MENQYNIWQKRKRKLLRTNSNQFHSFSPLNIVKNQMSCCTCSTDFRDLDLFDIFAPKILIPCKFIYKSCFCLHSESENVLYSQLEDENDLTLVLKHIMQSDDIGMLDLLQDAHFPLNVLLGHPTPTRLASTLLDELCSILISCALLTTFPHHGKLTTGEQQHICG